VPQEEIDPLLRIDDGCGRVEGRVKHDSTLSRNASVNIRRYP
jgi:hypothetical protein